VSSRISDGKSNADIEAEVQKLFVDTNECPEFFKKYGQTIIKDIDREAADNSIQIQKMCGDVLKVCNHYVMNPFFH
jgi:N-acetylglutamate synthase-like GNAT family acetyltransferase